MNELTEGQKIALEKLCFFRGLWGEAVGTQLEWMLPQVWHLDGAALSDFEALVSMGFAVSSPLSFNDIEAKTDADSLALKVARGLFFKADTNVISRYKVTSAGIEAQKEIGVPEHFDGWMTDPKFL